MKQQSYFRSSGFLHDATIETNSGVLLDLTQLPAFLRTLLVTDGTVTKSLEAWFWENVRIKAISNHLEILENEIVGLEAQAGDKVLQREVMLKGVQSKNIYAAARSTVLLKYLPTEISDSLEKGEIGIGELLREKGVETYRDIFNINYFSAQIKDDVLISSFKTQILSRSYRIRVNGHPAIIVTEFFPIDIYMDNYMDN